MKIELKNWISKTYFGHLNFYCVNDCFGFPVALIIDDGGFVISFGFWGLTWSWMKEEDLK